MKIKELIEKLSQLDPELEVYLHGYEGGYCDVFKTEHITLCKDYYGEEYWWYGPHEIVDRVEEPSKYIESKGILLK